MPHCIEQGDVVSAAKWCLGKRLVVSHKDHLYSGIIVETEAYGGSEDKACHAYQRRTARNEAMFASAGTFYVYLIYGMYFCINLVVGATDDPKAVLIRALEPDNGIATMRRRRKQTKTEALCSGPGKLCQALGINIKLHNQEHAYTSARVWLEQGIVISEISKSPRIGISQSTELPWRYFAASSRCVSSAPKEVRRKVEPV